MSEIPQHQFDILSEKADKSGQGVSGHSSEYADMNWLEKIEREIEWQELTGNANYRDSSPANFIVEEATREYIGAIQDPTEDIEIYEEAS